MVDIILQLTTQIILFKMSFPPIPPTSSTYEFEYLPEHTRRYVKDAYDVISRNEWWVPFREALKSRGVNPNTGFMFTDDPFYNKIQNAIHSTTIGGGHSGSSMGYVMREMELIALYGEEVYKEIFVISNSNVQSNTDQTEAE